MRYDKWDVILFPKDSHVPVQEFRTACYSSRDLCNQTPILVSYVKSLPTSAPFRISLHSWETPAQPSLGIEALRREGQKIMYMIQVIIDGKRVYHGLFHVSSRWPKEITHESPMLTSPEQSTNVRQPHLSFPPFYPGALLKPTWDICDQKGRINIVLSEQLIGSANHLELGATIDIACFCFIHAAGDILEQTGISWPIRNPLYLANTQQAKLAMPLFAEDPKIHTYRQGTELYSPFLFPSRVMPEPVKRPNSHPPALSHYTKPVHTTKHGDPSAHRKQYSGIPQGAHYASRDSWSSLQPSFLPTNNVSTGEPVLATSFYGQLPGGQSMRHQQYAVPTTKENDQRVMVTLRDDQLGQIIDAMSPLKQYPGNSHSASLQQAGSRPSTSHANYPTKMQSSFHGLTHSKERDQIPKLSSWAASRADRKATKTPHRVAESGKENCAPSQLNSPTSLLENANRVPAANSFVTSQAHWDSDVFTGDSPSALPGLLRTNQRSAPNLSGKHITHHNFSNMPGPGTMISRVHGTHHNTERFPKAHVPMNVEIIDVDALDAAVGASPAPENQRLSPLKTGHRAGTSSMDSTIRLERQLYSALGDELGGFEHKLIATPIGIAAEQPRTPTGLMLPPLRDTTNTPRTPIAGEAESIGKRKWEAMPSTEQDENPAQKREKSEA